MGVDENVMALDLEYRRTTREAFKPEKTNSERKIERRETREVCLEDIQTGSVSSVMDLVAERVSVQARLSRVMDVVHRRKRTDVEVGAHQGQGSYLNLRTRPGRIGVFDPRE